MEIKKLIDDTNEINSRIKSLEEIIYRTNNELNLIYDELRNKIKDRDKAKKEIEDKWLELYESHKRDKNRKITKEYAMMQARNESDIAVNNFDSQIRDLEVRKKDLESKINEIKIEVSFLKRKFELNMVTIKYLTSLNT